MKNEDHAMNSAKQSEEIFKTVPGRDHGFSVHSGVGEIIFRGDCTSRLAFERGDSKRSILGDGKKTISGTGQPHHVECMVIKKVTLPASPKSIEELISPFAKTINSKTRLISFSHKAKIPQATFITPMAPELSAGIVIINLPGKQSQEVFQKLYDSYGIGCATSGGIRLSPHIYNTRQDLDKVVDALASIAA